MRPFSCWTHVRDRQPLQLLCVECGALRPALVLPEHKVDPVTRTLGGLVSMGFALYAARSESTA